MSMHYFTAIVKSSIVRIEVITKETNYLYGTNIESQF
jgi:hypothetical protein